MNISTSLEEDYVERINRLAEKDVTSTASIVRKCVVRYLPELEKELGILPTPNGQDRKEKAA